MQFDLICNVDVQLEDGESMLITDAEAPEVHNVANYIAIPK